MSQLLPLLLILPARRPMLKGGAGSGNHGHTGRPGLVGGSAAATIAVTHIAETALVGTTGKEWREAAKAHARQHFTGGMAKNSKRRLPLRIHNAATGFEIGLSYGGVKHAVSRGVFPDHYRTVIALPDLLRHAVLLRTERDNKNRHSIAAIHFMAAPMAIDDRLYAVRMVIREDSTGKLYYDHMLTGLLPLSRRPPVPLPGQTGQALRDGKPGGHQGDDTLDMADFLAEINEQGGTLAKALAPGERWITVRPNGPGTEGHALLIKPAGDGSMKVVGGAGGSLNHLRLTNVRSEADYKAEAASRAKLHKEAKKRQTARDKADGLHGNKTAAREAVRAQVADHRTRFVDAVAAAAGWKPEQTRFPEEKFQNASPEATRAAAQAHAARLYAEARRVVDLQRRRLVSDAEMRAAGGLGEVPLTSAAPDAVSVQDLAPIDDATRGLGFTPEYGKRAAAAGLKPDELKQEAAAAKPTPAAAPTAAAPTAAESRQALAEKVKAELQDIRVDGPTLDPAAVVDAKVAVDLLRAEKALKAVERQARAANKSIAEARELVEPNAYPLETSGTAPDDAITRDLENDLRTIRTRAFLDEVGRVSDAQSLGRHVGVGAYNSINALALAAGGASLIDRSVVDVLGVAGSAQVLARRLASDLTPEELERTRDAMATFHVDHYMEASGEALREARQHQEMAAEIELGEAADGASLAMAQELNAKRREFTASAQRTLGTALGEMEANAALVVALKQPKKDKIDVALGKVSVEAAITRARALGLERGDYQVEKIGATTFLTVRGSGMDRLAQPVAKEDLQRTRTAMDIIEGRHDEEGWLPDGVTKRPEAALTVKPGSAPRLAQPFRVGSGGVEEAVADYIGGRAADGDAAADIVAGLLNEDTLRAAGDRGAFMAAVDKLAPLYDANGKMIRAETHQAAFDGMADAYAAKTFGDKLQPIHKQQFGMDQVAVDALHQALAQHPDGVAAFKPVGEMTPQDQGALRRVFGEEFGRSDPEVEAMTRELAAKDRGEPAKIVQDMFGEGPNPAHADWKADRDALAEKLNKSTMSWGKYLDVMGSPANAYAAMADVVKGRMLNAFALAHNRAQPGAALKIGRTVIANDLNHLDALDPAARERRLAAHRNLVDGLRNRVAGRYSAGGVAEKVDAARAADEAASQAQMGLFGGPALAGPGEEGGEGDDTPAAPARPLSMGERATIGHAAERQVAGMMPVVGAAFRPGQKVALWSPNMSGKYVMRQRAVKLIQHNRRTELGMGVGSGKTSIMLSAFTHMHAAGQVKRGVFAVPSIVQGQFHGEALTLLEPGKYKWHADPNASRADRIAAYKDPSVHFNVVTHQALRDDMLHLASQREGTTPDAVAAKLDAMQPAERQSYMRELMEAEGIGHDYMAVDEGHTLLNRAGKENSRMANVLDGMAHGMKAYVSATADPVKNDTSEAFDVLAKMDPARYHDRDAFMRKYGVDSSASREGLRREMARHFYTGKIDPGVKAERTQVPVELTPAQHAQVKGLDDAASKARLARMGGTVDLEALRALSPGSFKGVDPAQHEAVAHALNHSIGILHNTALHHAVNGEASVAAIAKLARERRGKPGVVFARHLDRVGEITAALKAEGHRVVTLTGKDSTAEKDRKKREYQAGQHDVMVMSDAGAVGANLQHGKWLAQFDVPQTAMLHAQRQGRIHRQGQTADVELLDVAPNHPLIRQARKRLATKYELRDIVTSPMEGLDDSGVAGYLNRARAGRLEAAQLVHPAAADAMARPAPEAQAGLF